MYQRSQNYKYIFSNKMESKRRSQQRSKVDEKLDEEFVSILTVIENNYFIFNRHIQIRIEKWVEKLLQYDSNNVWRKIRNHYLRILHDMVQKKKIEGIFSRMPPQGDLPVLFQQEHKKSIKDSRAQNKQSTPLNQQISIKKIDEIEGDSVATPGCDTGRQTLDQPNRAQNKNYNPSPQQETEQKNAILWQKLNSFLIKNHNQLKKDKEYYDLMREFNNIWPGFNFQNKQQEDYSAELKVQQGIEVNKINLFQFGSPRGMTQMQYFKAALQL